MSGNEPYRSANDESPEPANAGSIYGAPRSNLDRIESDQGDEAPPRMAPLSLNDDDSTPLEGLGEGADDARGLDLREPPSLGNRPASGARVVSVSEVFSEHFMGAEGASDFLGLDTEFDPTPVGTPGSPEFVLADVARATATEEEFQGGFMSPMTSPEADPDYAFAGEASTEFGDELPAGDLSGGDEPFSADEPFLDEELEPQPARRARPGKLIGAVCLLGAAAAAAVFIAPRFLGGKPEEPATTIVARNTPPRVKPEPAATTTPDVAPDAPGTPGDSGPRPLEDFSSAPVGTTLPSGTDPVADLGSEEISPEAVPDAEPLDPDSVLLDPAVTTATELEAMLAEASLPESFYQTHTGLLDLVWRGETVPLEAIRSPNRILTPAVGPVRVYLESGSVFDGRLFAVGENKVWVDAGLGRMGIDGTQVVRLDSLPKDVVLPTEGGAIEVVTGERVRARVPGGVIYGFVRSHKGNEVTLITESGARITLIDPDLEPASDPKRVSLRL
jgi:hypothetical protein